LAIFVKGKGKSKEQDQERRAGKMFWGVWFCRKSTKTAQILLAISLDTRALRKEQKSNLGHLRAGK